ncbi:ATP-dependent RNA helicase DeaD [Butyrivibrio proteoclasticus]|uniref:ATP-dependent RNA helicase CshA n=1 Tax=Butyrivibrio proteoclasticus TaxID=43305 RepID=A0A1I5UA46_9FIRM|nr:DEAD/DEAH box helicase [Butyrivibrio proteoclasticus]SFP92169.1 ATP-dependent RNA helicase DeaD [Butyrivibrio proteoclasticus]
MSKDLEKNTVNVEEEKVRYEDSGLDEKILRAVSEMGFEYMSPIQKAAIPVMLEGKDIIGQAQTGTGKTAAFGIPLLQQVDPANKHLQAVVLCPTRELAMQAADDIRDFAKYMFGIKVLAVYGGQDISRQIKALSAGVQIVVGTPGRVMDHMRRHTMKMKDVKVLVLDEADEMLDMGFRDDIETILQGMPEERQTALFSATMPEAILQITKKYQKEDAEYIKMTPKEITVAAIEQSYYRVPQKSKEEVLVRLMDYYNPSRSLIFCNTKRMVDQLAESLKGKGYQADGLHGDLSQNQRDTVMNLFRSGRINILIATDVAARGIDVSGVEAVFNFDIPEDIEYYVHRIGRTGRAGRSGQSFTLVGGREMYKLREIEKVCHTKIEERKVPSAKEITRVKSQKVFAEVIDIIENGDISSALEFVNQKVEEGEYTAEQLAAGFMKLKMGADIEDLVFDFGHRRGDRDKDRGKGTFGRGRRDGRMSRDGRKFKSGKDDRKGRRSLSASDRKLDKKKVSPREELLFEKPKRRNKSKDEITGKTYLDEALVESIKKDRNKTADKNSASRATRAERKHSARGNAEFENVGRLNIKSEESTKAWYVGEDSNTMNVSKSEKKHIKAENKKRSIDYLQDVSDFVMESFGKRRK